MTEMGATWETSRRIAAGEGSSGDCHPSAGAMMCVRSHRVRARRATVANLRYDVANRDDGRRDLAMIFAAFRA
jgi:hypothetical protein